MVQQVPCPKCAAKAGESCGHRKDKTRSHHQRLVAAQKHYNTGAKKMAEYDNKNQGAGFQPYPDQKFILSGKMDIKGNERKIVMMAGTTQNGKKIVEVYQRCSIMFEETNPENNKPNYSGPLDDYTVFETENKMRMAGWVKEHDGKKMISFEISPSISQDNKETNTSSGVGNDQIPPF